MKRAIIAGPVLLIITFAAFLCGPIPAEAFEKAPEISNPADSSRVIGLDGARNFRDVGGYRAEDGRYTKWGQIYRSDNLSELSEDDFEVLQKLDLGLVIDFRSPAEQDGAQTQWPENRSPETVNLAIGNNAADWSSKLSRQLRSGEFTAEEIKTTFVEMYSAMPFDAADQFAEMFDRIDDDTGQPVLLHCTAGKDRTGVGIALILSALDVPWETIMADFLLTNEVADVDRALEFVARGMSTRTGRNIDPQQLRPLIGVEREYLEATFQSIESRHGSVEAYLTDSLGLTPARRSQLRDALLE